MLSSSHINIISKILTSYFYITQQDSRHVEVWAPQTVSVMSRSYLIVARGGGWCWLVLAGAAPRYHRNCQILIDQYPCGAAMSSHTTLVRTNIRITPPITQIFSHSLKYFLHFDTETFSLPDVWSAGWALLLGAPPAAASTENTKCNNAIQIQCIFRKFVIWYFWPKLLMLEWRDNKGDNKCEKPWKTIKDIFASNYFPRMIQMNVDVFTDWGLMDVILTQSPWVGGMGCGERGSDITITIEPPITGCIAVILVW